MPSPTNKTAPISTGLHPASANKKKDKTPRNSPSNAHAGGRTPRANTNADLPLVAPPDPKAFTKKARKTVKIKGNRGKGQSKSGAGGVVVDSNDKEEEGSGSGSESSSNEENGDAPELGSAATAEVQMDELVRAAEERAANGAIASPNPFHSALPPVGSRLTPLTEPVKITAGYELITNPASKPMLFDPRHGRVARRASLASSTGFTDESDWCELNMDGIEVPVQRAKYAEVVKKARAGPTTAAIPVVGGARA